MPDAEPVQTLTQGMRVTVDGLSGIGTVMAIADLCMVKMDSGQFARVKKEKVHPYVADTKLKAAPPTVLIHSENTGTDPLSQPKRDTGRSVAEDQSVLGKSASTDLFAQKNRNP